MRGLACVAQEKIMESVTRITYSSESDSCIGPGFWPVIARRKHFLAGV